MSYQDSSGYATAPYTSPAPPERTIKQSPPLTFEQNTGTFKIVLKQPRWIERGLAVHLNFYAEHYLDGPVSSYTTGPTISVLDQFGYPVLPSYVTIVAAQPDPATSGAYFSDVTFNTNAPEGDYVIQWVATYKPSNETNPLALTGRQTISTKVTKGSSKIFFKRTDQF